MKLLIGVLDVLALIYLFGGCNDNPATPENKDAPPIVQSFSVVPSFVEVGQNVKFAFSVTDDEGLDSLVLKYGDGGGRSFIAGRNKVVVDSVEHSYSSSGAKTAVLTAYADGKTDAKSVTIDPQASVLPMGISFPPVRDAIEQGSTLPYLHDLKVTKIRIAESWQLREPSQGTFNWAPLDSRINFVTQNNMELLQTIETKAPTWANPASNNELSGSLINEASFKKYVDTLLQRYPNKISKIQFGNEWDAWGSYAGSADDFVKFNNILYTATKLYSPQTTVVLGGVTAAYPLFVQIYKLGGSIIFPATNHLVPGKTLQTFISSFLVTCADWNTRGLEARMNTDLHPIRRTIS